jgi:hypothetical protein
LPTRFRRAGHPTLPRPAGELVVEVDDAGGDQRPAVVGAAVLVGAVAAPLPLLRVGGGSQKRLCERVLVVVGNEPAGSWGDDPSGFVRPIVSLLLFAQ